MDGRPPNVPRFFANRAPRIFPAYIVITLLASYILQAARLPGVGPTGETVKLGALSLGSLIPDLLLVQTFIPAYIRTGVEVAWTLTVELTFYLLLPVLFVTASWLFSRSVQRVWAAFAPAIAMLLAGFST